MEKWKYWLICYSVKYTDGRIEEKIATVKGNYIVTALGTALCDIIDPIKEHDDVADAVIWNIGIIYGDVFPEAEQEQT